MNRKNQKVSVQESYLFPKSRGLLPYVMLEAVLLPKQHQHILFAFLIVIEIKYGYQHIKPFLVFIIVVFNLAF